MKEKEIIEIIKKSNLFKAHPWHGIDLWNDKNQEVLNTYIEIVPENRVKYELDKDTGYLKIDRPQKFSNIIPCLYGFIPKTYSKTHSADHANKVLDRSGLVGDDDPIDICVLTDRNIKHGDILLEAIPIGGLRMLDHSEVDDKIIAVLKDDATYGSLRDISEMPKNLLDSIQHYFLTYKEIPGGAVPKVEIAEVYGREEVLKVIEMGEKDYHENFHS